MSKFSDLLTTTTLSGLKKRQGPFEYGDESPWGPSIKYRRDILDELEAVFRWVVEKVEWTSDKKTRGKVEHWGLPIFLEDRWRGDCDDFTSAFRLVLRKLGWDEKVLRRMVCFVPTNEKPIPKSERSINHAVLSVIIVHKNKLRLLVLDNRQMYKRRGVRSLRSLVQNGEFKNVSILSTRHGKKPWRRVGL